MENQNNSKDRSVLRDKAVWIETLFVFVAVHVLVSLPFIAYPFLPHSSSEIGVDAYGLCVVVGSALVAAVILFIAARLSDGRFQLHTGECAIIAAAYGLASALGPLCYYSADYWFKDYEAAYIAYGELRFFFGCAGAALALVMLRKLELRRTATFLAVVLFGMLLRYAAYRGSIGISSGSEYSAYLLYLPFLGMTLPVALIAGLFAFRNSETPVRSDLLCILAVWLISFFSFFAVSFASESKILKYGLFFSNDPVSVFLTIFWIIPLTLSWPAFRLLRPHFLNGISDIEYSPVVGKRVATACAVAVLAIGAISVPEIIERSSYIYKCTNGYDDAAVARCTAVVDAAGTSPNDRILALVKRASIAESSSKYQSAVADYSQLIQLAPAEGKYYASRAAIWAKIDNYDLALSDYDDAIKLDPTNVDYYSRRSDLWETKDDQGRVLADLSQVIRLQPTAENFRRRGNYNLRKDLTDAAVADYTVAIKLDPTNVEYLTDRAEAWQKKGNSTEANADFERIIKLYDAAIKTDPSPDNFKKRAHAYKDRKDFDSAISDYGTAISLAPDRSDLYDVRASAAKRKFGDNSDELMAYLGDVIRREPARAQNYRVRAELWKGVKAGKAIADYSEAIRLKPDEVSFYKGRADTWMKMQDIDAADKAAADYNEAIRLTPEADSWDVQQLYAGRAATAMRKLEFERAISDYNRSRNEYADTVFGRGRAYIYLGNPSKALQDLKAYYEARSWDVYAALWLEIAERRNNSPSHLAENETHFFSPRWAGIWPTPLVKMMLGEISLAQTLAAAESSDTATTRAQTCEVNFFAGEVALPKNQGEAKRLFKLAANDCLRNTVEWEAASAELKNLGGAP